MDGLQTVGRVCSVLTISTLYSEPDEIVVNGRRYVPAEG